MGDQHTAATGQKLESSQEGGQQGLGGHGRGSGSINLRKLLPDHVGFKERSMAQEVAREPEVREPRRHGAWGQALGTALGGAVRCRVMESPVLHRGDCSRYSQPFFS